MNDDSLVGGQSVEQHRQAPGSNAADDVADTAASSRTVRFKVRIADLDYYMATPGPLDLDSCQFLPPNCPVLKVPVVRLYGSNEAGQKTCLHIHKAYPYFYVPYEGSLEPSHLYAYIHQLGNSLNHAACITFNAPQNLWKSQYVAAIVPVKGIPFYGYHVGYSYFLKICLFNPDFESRIVDLMRSGAIMGTKFQPFESHIPFRLQFFIDFNLYGMGWIELEEALLRNEVPDPRAGDHPLRLTTATVADTRIWSPENDPGRISHCEIEMDSAIDRIVNRDRAPERRVHHSLDECFKSPSLTAQDDARRRKFNGLPTQELPKTQIRDPVSVPWLNYDTNKKIVADMVQEIMSQSLEKTFTQGDFDSFNCNEDPLGKSFMTAYESIDYLSPRTVPDTDDLSEEQETSFVYNEDDSSILVDESIISQAMGPFEEDNMDSRREILKGLAGLGGTDEQDEDENILLADVEDFLDDDFLDEADLWDGMDTFEPDGHDDIPATELNTDIEQRIPQYDGGADSEKTSRKKDDAGVAANKWLKVVHGSGRKRARPSSSSLGSNKATISAEAGAKGSDVPDDPIVVDDDSDDDAWAFSRKPDRLSKRSRPTRERTITRNNLASLLDGEYPEPASPDREYFLANMDEMWSSPSPPLDKPAFLYSPPRPTSPDLIPAQNPTKEPLPLDVPEYVADPVNTDTIHSSRNSRKNSTVVEQTFIENSFTTQEVSWEATPHPSHGTRSNRESMAAGRVLVEDTIIHGTYQTQSPQSSQSSKPSQSHQPSTTSILPPSLVQSPTPPAYQFSTAPPTTQELLSSLSSLGLPNMIHQKPHFSNEADVPSRTKVFGGKEFRVQSKGIKTMRPFKGVLDIHNRPAHGAGFRYWEPNYPPPSQTEIQEWLKAEEERAKASLRSAAEVSTQKRREQISQIEGPTQKNLFGYKNSPTKIAASVAVEKDYMDILSLELHCCTRGALLPDPKVDPIKAVFYCWQTESEGLVSNGWVPGYRVGIFTHAEAGMMQKLAVDQAGFDIHMAENEGAMMNAVIRHVQKLDPDILAGYEVHNLSWGYLVDRYQIVFGLDMSKLLSRVRPPKIPVLSKSAIEAKGSYNSRHHAGLKIVGRHLFNVWRLIRSEVALNNYGFCNVIFHVLQQRIPHYSHETLTTWWTDGVALHQSRVIRNYLHRVQYSLQLIESQELVSRTSEFARVFGVDFYSVISRGSQYKVESMMVRLAKPENFIMISPSRVQVAGQRALEVIPMVMEPESGFYEDPVVVLDFQSLYPSVMIAYNICYSTCLGKLGGSTKLGVLNEYRIKDGLLPLVEEHLHLAPNNVMYVNQDIRRGLLGRMLAEILDTRVMVKKAMKEYPDNKSLLKLLNLRQLSLKFIANVTYGYTSASFSGRMPGIEIADSIVLSGRETLERSIRFVNDNPKWNARVVYGDTDSMFVQLKGRTRQEAFEIGYDIAETITRMNPRPVKLKFEKVYHPCFLVTKKRYVGSSYETPDQKEPIFDAKGIETIRRDGVPAVQKIMETCIKTMFRTQDLSLVKSYFVRQLGKILEGRVPVPDLMFGKEVRMGGYSEKGVPPPGAVVSARRMELDPRAEPQHGERVPYVVVYGDPGARLTDQVIEPKELLVNKDLRLNGEYYIRKHVIPSMERIFQLAGADVKSWYDEMPRVQKATPLSGFANGTRTGGNLDRPGVVGATGVELNAAAVSTVTVLKDPGSPMATTTTTAVVAATAALGPPKFKPKRRGGKGFVSVGSRIDRYYQSQLCTICSKLIVGQRPGKDLCSDCTSDSGRVKSLLVVQNRLSKAEKLFRATVDVCSSCSRCAPNGGGGVSTDHTRDVARVGENKGSYRDHGAFNTGMELVACESLECNVFWQRRRAQDSLTATRQLTDRVITELDLLELF
ncbi:DNA polymerase zeta [Dissophora globulifera]|uniref:DNA polymerase n=1 Tax=Dissophora globulifera TaxID=979702 RepID=A0A9P6RVG2_9FUNG|nr:DNA polymerase zeta [Dissophora globulifera]